MLLAFGCRVLGVSGFRDLGMHDFSRVPPQNSTGCFDDQQCLTGRSRIMLELYSGLWGNTVAAIPTPMFSWSDSGSPVRLL